MNIPNLSTAIAQQLLLPLPQALFTTQEFCVQGNFQIDQPYYITTNSEISMDTDAAINIPINVFLVISETTIKGCSHMWDAIHVETGATLAIVNSEIWDGKRAVLVSPFSNLTLTNNTFFNNFVHVDLFSPEQVIGLYNTSITGNLMATHLDYQLKPPYYGENCSVGIKMTRATGVTVGNMADIYNNVLRADHGILANNSYFTVVNTYFDDLTNPFNPNEDAGTGLTLSNDSDGVVNNCVFRWCNIGVNLEDSGIDFQNNTFIEQTPTGVYTKGVANKLILVKDNDITVEDIAVDFHNITGGTLDIDDNTILVVEEGSGTSMETGIFLTDCHFDIDNHAKIRSNDLEMTDGWGIGATVSTWVDILENPTIDLTNTSGKGKGIHLDGNEFLQINRNVVTGPVDFATLPNQSYGIEPYIFNSHISYCCNDINDTYYGVYFTGPNGGSEFYSTLFDDHNFALVLDGLNIMTAIGPQDHTGNNWPGVYPGNNLGAQFLGDEAMVSNSRFFVETLGVPLSPEEDDIVPNPNSGVIWFVEESGTSPTCVTLCPVSVNDDGDQFKNIDSLDIRIANTQLSATTVYDPTAIWMFERYLYSKLELFPDLRQTFPEMVTFHTNRQNTTVGKFHNILEGIRNLHSEPASEVLQYESNNELVNTKLKNLIQIDSSLFFASSQDSITLLAQRGTLLAEIQNLKVQNDSLLNLMTVHRQSLIQQLISQNNAIVVTETYESNEKTVNDVYLNTIAQGNRTFTTQQLNDLASISGQCAYSGGGAVLRARAMYQLEVDTTFDDEVLCVLPSPLTSLNELNDSDINWEVFPNPASSEIQIRFTDQTLSPVKAQISNLNGQLIESYMLSGTQNTYSLSTEALVEGAYFISITLENGERLSEKILILK